MNLEDVLKDIQRCSFPGHSADYTNKMVHSVPETIVVNRLDFLKAICKDKIVLSIGCKGVVHPMIEKVAKEVWGIDRGPAPEIKNYFDIDVEQDHTFTSGQVLARVNIGKDYDLVLCGEILEHLSNPGRFLNTLKDFNCPIIITVPNAFYYNHFELMKYRRVENVNLDHVNYYTYYTLKALVERYGYKIIDFMWYDYEVESRKSPPGLTEGLIFVVRRKSNGLS